MECSHIREHLSDYIDENLEPTTKALVEEHLSTCKDCRQEAASLRMLIDDLGSIEPVVPPKNFLDQLHKRMERRSWFSKILDTLSIPVKVNLPVKLAGALIMAVLVFTIFQIQEDQYGTKIAPIVQEQTQSESSPPRMVKAPLGNGEQEEAHRIGVAREMTKPKHETVQVVEEESGAEHPPESAVKKIAQVRTMADHPPREGGPIEWLPTKMEPSVQESKQLESSPHKMANAILENGAQEEANNNGVVRERAKSKFRTGTQAVAQKDEAISLPDKAEKRIAYVGTKADHPSLKGDLIELSLVIERVQLTRTFEVASDMEAPRRIREKEMRRTPTMGEVLPTTQMEREKSIEHLLLRLREVIERAGGEVVSVQYEEKTDIPESVRVEIPAEKIDIFRNDLQTLGELHGAPISPAGEDKEILPIQIRLLTP